MRKSPPASALPRTPRASGSPALQRCAQASGKKRRARRRHVALGVALEQAPAHAAPPALAQGLSAILAHGAVPSASIMSLVTGVLKTMRNAKLIFTAGISAAVLVLTATAYFAATAFAVDDKPSPTPVPPIAATAPVKPVASLPPVAPPPPVAPVAKFGPAKTPKATVVSAWNACLAGDEDGALSCFDGITDAQTATLRLAAQSFHAFNDLAQAIGDKYGAQARQQFMQKMFNGVNPARMSKMAPKQLTAPSPAWMSEIPAPAKSPSSKSATSGKFPPPPSPPSKPRFRRPNRQPHPRHQSHHRQHQSQQIRHPRRPPARPHKSRHRPMIK